jgi:inorganic pyrophosphatase
MRTLFKILVLLVMLNACGNKGRVENSANNSINFLHDISAFTYDSLVNVVIEIPAGSNQKWEVNKTSGQIEWEQVSPDSFRVINYLPYPANYGFVPQTLLAKASGGDGDPVDVFVLGERIERGNVVPCRIIGLIEMTDNGVYDGKFIALPVKTQWKKINTLPELNQHYPGVMNILLLWLLNYKGSGKVEILSENDEKQARNIINEANSAFINNKNE